jgi:Cu+-exporting ATPase
MNGQGIQASTPDMSIRLGVGLFASSVGDFSSLNSSAVHVNINEAYKGYFEIQHAYREGVDIMLSTLKKKYILHILSGDNNAEKANLEKLFGKDTAMCFSVSPQQKLEYIKELQLKGAHVLMIGDGLNDAGALRQSEVGLAVSEHKANFSPACDGIIDGNAVKDLASMLHFARMGKTNVSIGFIFSILYNIIGISLAVRGELSPVLAAILMPISSISIVAISILSSSWSARRIKWGI